MTFIPIHSQHGATTAMRHALVEYMDKCTQIKIQRKNMHRMCNEILAKVLKITQLFANDTFHVHFYRRAPQTSFCIRIPLFVFLVSLPFFLSVFPLVGVTASSSPTILMHIHSPVDGAPVIFRRPMLYFNSVCVCCALAQCICQRTLFACRLIQAIACRLAVNRAIEPSSRHCRPRVHA